MQTHLLDWISWLAFPPPALFQHVSCVAVTCTTAPFPQRHLAFAAWLVIQKVYHLTLRCVFKGSLIRYDTWIGPGASRVLDKPSTVELYHQTCFDFWRQSFTKLPGLIFNSLCSPGRSSTWFSSLGLTSNRDLRPSSFFLFFPPRSFFPTIWDGTQDIRRL